MREALFEIYTWIPPWETNKKNSILIFILYQNCTVLATKYPFLNTRHQVINLRASLFVVTSSHVASWKIECQNFSYVYRSRKHWKCKYLRLNSTLGDGEIIRNSRKFSIKEFAINMDKMYRLCTFLAGELEKLRNKRKFAISVFVISEFYCMGLCSLWRFSSLAQ